MILPYIMRGYIAYTSGMQETENSKRESLPIYAPSLHFPTRITDKRFPQVTPSKKVGCLDPASTKGTFFRSRDVELHIQFGSRHLVEEKHTLSIGTTN